MNLSIFNSKFLKNRILRSLIAVFSFLSIYQFLIITKLVKPSNGMHQWQNNLIRLQRYAYQDFSNLNLVIVGSSIANNLPASDIGSSVINLAMSGGCAQTGIESVARKSSKPAILLIEINETINRKVDEQAIRSIYNPFLYNLRLYIPMLREEYQPVSTLSPRVFSIVNKIMSLARLVNKPKTIRSVASGTNRDNQLTKTLINQAIEKYTTPLSEKEKSLFREEAEHIKFQISKLNKDGVRVVLFDIPRDPHLQATVQGKQLKALAKELFPVSNYEWLPEPAPRDWITYDGVHLVTSDAKDYTAFLKNQLFIKK
ncbi:hypothetical protein [Allocoleopsis sp.]|uniref:hypothetical protein n=1 Tax=Allocoleopsis sp. TaxID=3088169 RepID=UPI002FD4CFEA